MHAQSTIFAEIGEEFTLVLMVQCTIILAIEIRLTTPQIAHLAGSQPAPFLRQGRDHV